jgi:hypothetical protein
MAEDTEYFNAEAVSVLTDEEKILMCQCINNYGSGDHPWADDQTLEFFEKNYALGCVALAYYSGNMSEKGKYVAETVIAKFPDRKGGAN